MHYFPLIIQAKMEKRLELVQEQLNKLNSTLDAQNDASVQSTKDGDKQKQKNETSNQTKSTAKPVMSSKPDSNSETTKRPPSGGKTQTLKTHSDQTKKHGSTKPAHVSRPGSSGSVTQKHGRPGSSSSQKQVCNSILVISFNKFTYYLSQL